MKIRFYKYHGAGNDFILIDNRMKEISLNAAQIAHLCHRHFGIGADGLMLLEEEKNCDFRMVYYNSDGNESTMCGNGGRCITAFAKKLGIISSEATFMAIDGIHHAFINKDATISLEMIDVQTIEHYDGYAILNTGSPHYIQWVANVDETDVYHLGKSIRNQEQYQPKGINVNFVQLLEHSLKVRTYERGVEGETLSCGTGVTAAAIASTGKTTGKFSIPVYTPGGVFSVSFEKDSKNRAVNVVLKGAAVYVFEGIFDLSTI